MTLDLASTIALGLLILALAVAYGVFLYCLPDRAKRLISDGSRNDWAACAVGVLGIALLILL